MAMNTFVDSVKEKYHGRRINRDKQWPPCRSNKLFRLELVEGEEDDQIVGLDYGDLFKVECKSMKKILVEGDAGIGKTTLSTSVSEDWAIGKLFQQFELLLLLPLRYKKVATASSLPELLRFLHSSQVVCDSVAEYLEENEGNKVLIVADGWDELSESEKSESTFLYKLLLDDYLPLVSLIMTSRPSASARFHRLPFFDRFVKVRGFSKENIVEYISSEYDSDQEKAVRLKEQLGQNAMVESLCTVPLTCAIVCHLWRTLEEAFPTTMTELYTKIIHSVVLRNLQKNGFENVLSLSSFDALPTNLKPVWQLLCKFAYQTLESDQIVFSQEELANFFPQGLSLDKNSHCFGLLQSSQSILEEGYGMSFHFLHLTIQEYLAALHLVYHLLDKHTGANLDSSELPLVLKRKFFRSNDDSWRFEIVWRFLFGIYFNVVGHRDYQVIKPYISHHNHEVILCHCAFEAKNDHVNYDISHCLKTLRHKVSFESDSAYDCTAIIYGIDKIQELMTVRIIFSNCSVKEDQIKSLADVLAKNENVQVRELNLNGNKLTNQSVLNLFHWASSAFQSLKYLHLNNNRIGVGNIKFFPTQPPFNELSLLDLSHNPLEVSGMEVLQTAIASDSLAGLRKLLLQNTLTTDAETNATVLHTFVKALSIHCHHLKKLDLSWNNLGVPGASALGRIMSEHMKRKLNPEEQGWLSELKLNETHLGDEGLRTLVESLDTLYCFNTIYLRGNGIHAPGITCLVDAICSGNIILQNLSNSTDHRVELWLDDNPIGLDGIPAIGRLLSNVRSPVGCIGLYRCQLTAVDSNSVEDRERVGQKLCELPQNDTTQSLYLNGNSFTGEGIHVLAGLLYLCPRLQNLFTGRCEILSNDFKQLVVKLAQLKLLYPNICSELHAWDIGDNRISDDGLAALMELQLSSLFPEISGANKLHHRDTWNIMLNDNPVSNEGIRMLNTEWKRQYRLYHGSSNESSPSSTDDEEDGESSEADTHSFCGCSDCDNHSDNEVCSETESDSDSEGETDDENEELLYQEVTPLSSPCNTVLSEPSTCHEGKQRTKSKASQHDCSMSDAQTAVQFPDTSDCEQLNQVIDFENNGVPLYLGQIADSMYEWEGAVAERLCLTQVDVAAIKLQHPTKLNLQTREALQKWKQKLSSKATYKTLMDLFQDAGYQGYADTVYRVCAGENRKRKGEVFTSIAKRPK